MAQTKNALIRQRVIDRCLRSLKQYSIMDMIEKWNVMFENVNYRPVASATVSIKLSKSKLSSAIDAHYSEEDSKLS